MANEGLLSVSLTLAKQFLGCEVEVVMDRPLGSKHPRWDFIYEVNYGYVPGTLAPDGEALDAYFLGADEPVVRARGVCIAIIHRRNDDDDKLVVVPAGVTLSDEEIRQQVSFQEHYFDAVLLRK